MRPRAGGTSESANRATTAEPLLGVLGISECTVCLVYTASLNASSSTLTLGQLRIPKGALLSHENIQTSLFNVAHYERSTETDRALCFLPLNHVFGQIHISHSMIFCGGSLVLQPVFDLDRVMDAIQRFQVTNLYAVPTVYIRMLALDDLSTKIQSVRYCFSAAASMASEVVREWKSRTGLDIHESYGMTESASMVTYNHYHRHVVGSVGTPVSLIEVQIRDFDGNLLEAGEQGEICICGPNITQGYLNNPAETKIRILGRLVPLRRYRAV